MADANTTKAATPSKRASAPGVPETPDAEPIVVEPPAEVAETATPETAPLSPGWFRNAAPVPLTVLPDQYPSARLAPGESAWLPDDPHHPDLERCDAPAAAAADTTGSEK